MLKQSSSQLISYRPPVITILGHVDHGKTTLLDTIRKTNITAKEYGGITQHIGAYQAVVRFKSAQPSRAAPTLRRGGREIPNESSLTASDDFTAKSCKITFIDTPGHEAFEKMRSHGVVVADIAVLVVAANDGVMPQTIESVQHIKSAKIPCIVAINKIDLPDINLDKIKKQLVKLGLNLEEYGGETPVIPISAKTGKGIDKLLEMILLLAELNQIKDESGENLKAVVIESVLSKNRGPIATVIIKSGTLNVGDVVICENQEFKIRALIDWSGKNLTKVINGEPAEILGWKILPKIGSILYNKHQVELSGSPIYTREISEVSNKTITKMTPAPQGIEEEKIVFIIKADTTGTLEAVTQSLPQNITIINSGVGNITESDILLAKTTKALIIGFHLKTPDNILKFAESEKVIIKTYNIIYELFDEIKEVVEALKQGNLVTILGEAKIIAIFKIKDQLIAGVKVISGRIARGDQVKIVRGKSEVARARIKSLRHNKEDINKSEQGTEAGVLLSQNIEILTEDSIISIG